MPLNASSRVSEMELRPRHQDDVDIPQTDQQSTGEETSTPPFLKLVSCGFSFFVAGTNDGSIGALIPYILNSYKIGTSFIAILYLTTFLGWALAALSNPYLSRRLALGALLTIGSILQVLPHALRSWLPPFPLFAITFFLSGLGQAYQDSHANTFVSTVKGAHRWLGFIHAMYGLGLLVSPFIATGVATATHPSKWTLFYIFPLGLSVVNFVLVLVSFKESIRKLPSTTETTTGEETQQRIQGTRMEVNELLKLKSLWIFSLFFFFYLGVCFTSFGWVVQYLLSRPNTAPLSKLGYVPSGAYTGVFLGRLILIEPTHHFGERPMLFLYSVACLVLQLVFWLVPNLVSSIVVFSVMGFFLGPFFAAGISVASKSFPKRIQPTALGMIFVTAQAGGAIFPSLIGVIASRAGVKVLPPIVAGLILLMGATWALVPKPSEETHQD